MVDVDDPENLRGRLESALKRMEGKDAITDETYKAACDLADAHLEGRVPDDDQLAVGTLATYTTRLARFAADVDGSLIEADQSDLSDPLKDYRYQYSASYYNNIAAALRWLSDYHELGWDDSFTYADQEQTSVDEDKLFTDEEVNNYLEAGDARDQAMIGILADTGCRVGALTSFRIRDLDRSGDIPQLSFNTDAPTKGASGKILLSWSTGHINTYLSTDHPRPDDPNAPIIHKKIWSADDDGALSPNRVRARLKTLGEEIGIPRDRAKPHNFRHTAVSNWIRQGYDPNEIVHLASWASPDTLKIYDNVTDEQRNRDLAVKMGLVEDEEVATDPSEATIPCPQCDAVVRRNANFCPTCSLQMSRAPAFEDDDVDPVTIDEDASSDPQPGVPDDVWTDGAGDVLDDVPPEVLMQKLVEKTDVDASDLLDK